ncbi:AraC family transcriptional regulator [Phyllobacterium myrsinacearum]|uniref:AraC family transcriptional regulator n=1 Tax=Phyllobacterium myrsinacearum TaxID=28101 RepID=A0A2S9JB41_9HYPH|nr:AraC family transcriptional regulator [Phyllobacterium myrsinacearum]PRD50050.1 AraC family transcriptional regulator [Phyllobacterium myrsinacearum]PWV90912.1 AraC-like DNA-binding protein [Phyllobacterium myrsinacearum]RZU97313.1 AraC-like DNA-binding protein [Phyllobacterium myrsinacearum]
MDPLSDVLSLLKPHNHMSAGFDAGGEWSVQFPESRDSIKCGAVVSGQCWLSVDDVADPVRLDTGDCFLLPHGRPFRLASDLTLSSVEAVTVFSAARNGGIAVHKGGGDCFLVSSRFALTGNHASVLLGMLPPIVHIRKDTDQSGLRWPVELMMRELRERRPGGFLLVQHLAHMMLIDALRLHLAGGLQGGVGWLFALADRQMGAAIAAMHEKPAHHWTLQTLAERAGMSRSTFALKFKQTVGKSPMDYLTRWRMLLAGDRLQNSSDPVSAIALSLGYDSESAFSTAFKRVMGCSPRQYSRDGNAASSQESPLGFPLMQPALSESPA